MLLAIPDAFYAWLKVRLKEPKDEQAEPTTVQLPRQTGGKDTERRQLRSRTDKLITKISGGLSLVEPEDTDDSSYGSYTSIT